MAYEWNVPSAGEAVVRRRKRFTPPEWGPVGGDEGDGMGTPSPAPQDGSTALGGGYESGGVGLASSGDPMLDWIRNQAMADAGARTRGLRGAASRQVGADPSLGAWASLQGLVGGQSDAARGVNEGAFNRAQVVDERAWQEYIMRLRRQWAEEDARRQAQAAMWGNATQLGGAALGAAF